MYVKILDGVSATVSAGPRARAFGTIQTVAKAALVDGETFTINDGFAARVFEFDVTGNGVTAGRVTVDVSGATDAASVGVIVAAAINNATHTDSASTPFAVTAIHTATGLVYVKCDNFGTIGNQTITETVTDGSFAVAGMSGAIDGVSLMKGEIPGDANAGFLVDDLEDVLFAMETRSGTGALTYAGRLWVYVPIPKNLSTPPNTSSSLVPGIWCPAGIVASSSGADTDRGLLNSGVTIAESFSLTDYISFAQTIGNLKHCRRAYLQTTTLGQTSPIVDGWLISRTGAGA